MLYSVLYAASHFAASQILPNWIAKDWVNWQAMTRENCLIAELASLKSKKIPHTSKSMLKWIYLPSLKILCHLCHGLKKSFPWATALAGSKSKWVLEGSTDQQKDRIEKELRSLQKSLHFFPYLKFSEAGALAHQDSSREAIGKPPPVGRMGCKVELWESRGEIEMIVEIIQNGQTKVSSSTGRYWTSDRSFPKSDSCRGSGIFTSEGNKKCGPKPKEESTLSQPRGRNCDPNLQPGAKVLSRFAQHILRIVLIQSASFFEFSANEFEWIKWN